MKRVFVSDHRFYCKYIRAQVIAQDPCQTQLSRDNLMGSMLIF